jgi:outer membrane protein assembly factor BamB
MSWSAYSIRTGEQLWGPTASYNNSWGYYDNSPHCVIANGNFYVWSFGGEVHCFDLNTGTEKWSWSTGSAGLDTPYGTWPLSTWGNHYVFADGKLYVRAGHDYTPPVFKGAKLYCLNATTGEEIWSSLSFDVVGSPAVAEGYMLWFNGYDNQVYCYNRGPSETTISVPATAIPKGTPVLIKGTVTDQSPGQTCLGIPAAGTPAISDDSMSVWMEYLYQQQPKPTDATGVAVHLTAVDPNGNYQDIGTATSDALGNYAFAWTPPVPGLYTVTATFVGSNSYFSSEAGTAFVVSEELAASPIVAPTTVLTIAPTTAPTTAPTASPSVVPEPEAAPSTDIYIIAAAASVIIVVAAAAAVFLKKRK